jgi:hypothetical protein
MVNVHGMARLGVLAVGLGIGAAWAQTPVASADASSDWLSTIDSLLSGASPASATPIDLFISFDGYTIFDGGGSASAVTNSGEYGLAIAYGDDAYAYAGGGTGDYAFADGTNALAAAGGDGIGDTGADGDTAVDIGNNLGMGDGAWAGDSDLVGSDDGGTGVHDTAIDIGNNTIDGNILAPSGSDGAFAGAGGLLVGAGESADGNNDTAIDVGNNSGAVDGSIAVDGNGNYASESGSTTGAFEYAYAGIGNDNTAIADTSYTTSGDNVTAYSGSDNYASVLGPDNSTASASYGDSSVAYVLDPFGAAGSPDSAIAGGSGLSNDLAEVLFTHGNAEADTVNLLYDIVSLFGNFSGSF